MFLSYFRDVLVLFHNMYEEEGIASSSTVGAGVSVAPLDKGSTWANCSWAAALAAFLNSLSDWRGAANGWCVARVCRTERSMVDPCIDAFQLLNGSLYSVQGCCTAIFSRVSC